MDKDIGKIKKNDMTEIIVRVDEYNGKKGLTIREFTTSDKYTGFTKSGTRIPGNKVAEFKKLINAVDESDFEASEVSESTEENNEEDY